MYEAIILAGGFGTRLREAVPDLPKPMAPIADKPFLAWQMKYLIKQGVTHFILSVGYKAESIRNYFGNEYEGAIISYAEETQPLGTGGAIEYALQFAKQDRVFVLNGDSLCDVDLAALKQLCEKKPASVGILVKKVENAGRYGAITFVQDSKLVTAFGEKSSSLPGYINAGIYNIPRSLFDNSNCSCPFSFETEVIKNLVGENLFACEVNGFFIDIGIPEDFDKAQIEIPMQFS